MYASTAVVWYDGLEKKFEKPPEDQGADSSLPPLRPSCVAPTDVTYGHVANRKRY